jgi:transposase
MSLRLKHGHRIFVYSAAIDMRAGFDRLSMLVREKMGRSLVDGDLFLFLGNNRRRLKAICFDGTGLLLISKRLERGVFMPLSLLEDHEITSDELSHLLAGGLVRRARFGKEALTLSSGIMNVPAHAAPGARDEHRADQELR